MSAKNKTQLKQNVTLILIFVRLIDFDEASRIKDDEKREIFVMEDDKGKDEIEIFGTIGAKVEEIESEDVVFRKFEIQNSVDHRRNGFGL